MSNEPMKFKQHGVIQINEEGGGNRPDYSMWDNNSGASSGEEEGYNSRTTQGTAQKLKGHALAHQNKYATSINFIPIYKRYQQILSQKEANLAILKQSATMSKY